MPLLSVERLRPAIRRLMDEGDGQGRGLVLRIGSTGGHIGVGRIALLLGRELARNEEGCGHQQSKSSQPTWIHHSRNLGWLELLLGSDKIAPLR